MISKRPISSFSRYFLLGNELSGKGIGASVSAQQYGKDLVRLNTMVDELYASNAMPKPAILAPGGFYDKSWFDTLLQVSGPNAVNVLSHHMYTLGAGWFYLNSIRT